MSNTNSSTTVIYQEVIVLIGINKENYFLYKGEDHISQLLLADGNIPLPVRCLHFSSAFDVQLQLGEAVNVSQYWAINPEVVARLRNNEHLIETDD